MVRGIDHNAVTAQIDGPDGRVQTGAVVKMDGHRHLGAPGRGNDRRHDQLEIEKFVMRFGQTEDHRRARFFRRQHNAFEKIQADQIKGADRIVMIVGVLQHVFHIYQWHTRYLVSFSSSASARHSSAGWRRRLAI